MCQNTAGGGGSGSGGCGVVAPCAVDSLHRGFLQTAPRSTFELCTECRTPSTEYREAESRPGMSSHVRKPPPLPLPWPIHRQPPSRHRHRHRRHLGPAYAPSAHHRRYPHAWSCDQGSLRVHLPARARTHAAHPPRPSSSLREGARACDPAVDPPAAREATEPAVGLGGREPHDARKGTQRETTSERATCGAGPRSPRSSNPISSYPRGPSSWSRVLGAPRSTSAVRASSGILSRSPLLLQPNTAAPGWGRRRAIARLGRSCDESCGLVSA